MASVAVLGVGVAAAGLADWSTARAVLRGERAYEPAPFKPARTQLLPRNEARRAGTSVRLAFQAAEQACSGLAPDTLATVFASSAADANIADRLCRNLVDPEGAVSPTQFHNSVHNTAAGYWSIATGSREPASSLSGGHDSFATGLCEAWAMVCADRIPVLLVAFEAAGGGLLEPNRPEIVDSCAVALALAPTAEPDRPYLAALRDLTRTAAAATRLDERELERYRHYNPAGRGLGLLAALARDDGGQAVIESSQGNIGLTVEAAG